MGKVDRCRAVWDKYEFAQKRQCVLFATTNGDAYLQSQTGNRRWWPIRDTKICDLKRLAGERDQLAKEEAAGVSIRLAEEGGRSLLKKKKKRSAVSNSAQEV